MVLNAESRSLMAKKIIQYVSKLWNNKIEFLRDLFSIVLMDKYSGYRDPIATLYAHLSNVSENIIKSDYT